MNKKGADMGEAIVMIYRLLVISLIAFVVFGVSSIYYNYEIDVRDAEARILSHEISECLSGEGILNLNEIPVEDYGRIISYCGFDFSDRFYVGVNVADSFGKELARFYQGDSGALWVKELFVEVGNSVLKNNVNLEKYNPGYFKFNYPVFVLKDGVKREANIEMEVLINYDL